MDAAAEPLVYPTGRFQAPATHGPQLRQGWIAAIEALPQLLELSIENLDAAQLDTSYRPRGWSIAQVAHHLADSHVNAYVRLKLALTEDNPIVKPYEESLWAELPDAGSNIPVNVSVTLLHALHRRWTALLGSMDNAQWERTYHHPEQKRDVPIWSMTALYAWHGRHHVEQIRTLRQRMNW